MRNAFSSYVSKDFVEFGKNMGTALAKTFMGKNDVDKLRPDAPEAPGNSTSTQSEKTLFPVFNKKVYNDKN